MSDKGKEINIDALLKNVFKDDQPIRPPSGAAGEMWGIARNLDNFVVELENISLEEMKKEYHNMAGAMIFALSAWLCTANMISKRALEQNQDQVFATSACLREVCLRVSRSNPWKTKPDVLRILDKIRDKTIPPVEGPDGPSKS